MFHLWILIFYSIGALLTYGTDAIVPLEQFFPHGTENGDQEVPKTARGHDVRTSGLVDLDTPFRMFQRSLNQIVVREDGTLYGKDLRRGYGGHIWAFSAGVDLRKGGSVYWRKSSSAADLKKAREEIDSAFPAYQGVDLKWAFVATWYQVSPHHGSSNTTNTFQSLLATDGNQTYAIFMYNAIGWSVEIRRYAKVGFAIREDSKTYLVSGSDRPDISTIGNRSNIGIPGKWIFKIDQATIYEPSSVCGIPPQPENGLCKAEGFTPESTALCFCREGYKMDAVKLKCSQASNKTFIWSGNVPVCQSSIQTTAQSPQLPEKSLDSAVKCPSPPIPQYGRCEKKDYHPGTLAKCNCLENYRNTNPNGQLYCVIAEDGSLIWTGGMPMCVNSSA
ncbi:nidogen-like domain-containing protein [Ditylenchus destructor]|nr:nidogen-like domain-containing protein [Ditylenchus destructor]